MNLNFRRERTATDRLMLVYGTECGWEEFPKRAQAVINHLGMQIERMFDGLDERVWIISLGGHKFCVSWDIWERDVSVMPWEDTPDEAIEGLIVAID